MNKRRMAGKQWQTSIGLGLGLWLLCIVWPLKAHAENDALTAQLRDYLLAQTSEIAGSVTVDITMPSSSMPACHAPEPFLPGSGSRPWGRTTVGVKCPGDQPETRYFQAYVSITAPYYVAAHTLNPGDTIASNDLQSIEGDLTRLPSTIATDASTLVGQSAARRIGEGMPITTTMVKPQTVINRGSQVHLIAQGAGFSITSTGKALNDAPLGGDVRVRTTAGKIIVGEARSNDSVIFSL